MSNTVTISEESVTVTVGDGGHAVSLRGLSISSTVPTSGQALRYDGTSYTPTSVLSTAESDARFAALGAANTFTGANTFQPSAGNILTGRTPAGVLAVVVENNGVFKWGDTLDTNLYRKAANTLATDDAFEVGGKLDLAPAMWHTAGGQERFWFNNTAAGGRTFIRGTGVEFRGSADATLALINDSGNLGLGTTDVQAWSSNLRAIEATNTAIAFWSSIKHFNAISNAYFDTAWKYKTTGGAAIAAVEPGAHKFLVAPSGTADTAISWTTALTLQNNGVAEFGNNQSTKSVYPALTNSYQSGADALRWSTVYGVAGDFSGTITAASATLSSSLTVNGDTTLGAATDVARAVNIRRNGIVLGGMYTGGGKFSLFGGSGAAIHFIVAPTGDVETATAGKGYIATSPDGLTRRRISIDNTGAVVAVAV